MSEPRPPDIVGEPTRQFGVRVRQDQLDFLRGVAATYVVINHSRGHFFIGGDKLLAHDPSLLDYLTILLLQATSLGVEMVILFFVLSGFAMAHSVSRSSSVPMFYVKRAIRIWPPYIAATLLAFVIGLIVSIQVPVLKTMFYIQPSTKLTPQFWSLPYEVLFYALCPLLVAGRRHVSWFALFALLGAALTIILKGVHLNPWTLLFSNFVGNEMLFFACGAISYYNLERVPVIGPKPLVLSMVGAFALTLGLKLALGGPNMFSNLVVVGTTVLVLRNLPQRLPPWANLGSFSYSIYIYHFALLSLVGWGVRKFGVDPMKITNPFVWMLLPPFIIGSCYLLYLVTEKPCNHILLRLRKAQPADAGERAGVPVHQGSD